MELQAASSVSPRRVRRRWRVPPAILHGPEALESAGVLEEYPNDVGVVLWQSLRDVTLWATVPPSERDVLFSSDAEGSRVAAMMTAGIDAEIEPPLGLIAALVGRPSRISAERVSLACRQISLWAERHGRLATALAFAQAGALVCPGNASAAFKVGQIARRRAEYVRSETWLRRAIALARQEGDWTSYALGFSGLGNLYVQRGNFPKARALHVRALRAAIRHSHKSIQGNAHHDLFAIALECGRFEEAQYHARSAFDAYGAFHPRIHAFAHDVACLWMKQGLFSRALSVFLAAEPHFNVMNERLLNLGNIGRAAGGAGNRAVFDRVWGDLESMAEINSRQEGAAAAMIGLAHGAATLKDWHRAATAASNALEIAQVRSEGQVVFEAESLIDSLRSERILEVATSVIKATSSDNDGEDLAASLVGVLTTRAVALC
jgi:tetratricopeptide (TPR) repeat protein